MSELKELAAEAKHELLTHIIPFWRGMRDDKFGGYYGYLSYDLALDEKAEKAQHFRIRHGECDRDTSLVISAMLTAKLREAGCEVDYHSPWNTPHAGDYDLDELFAWIDGICG